jgi:hypothetical protein
MLWWRLLRGKLGLYRRVAMKALSFFQSETDNFNAFIFIVTSYSQVYSKMRKTAAQVAYIPTDPTMYAPAYIGI